MQHPQISKHNSFYDECLRLNAGNAAATAHASNTVINSRGTTATVGHPRACRKPHSGENSNKEKSDLLLHSNGSFFGAAQAAVQHHSKPNSKDELIQGTQPPIAESNTPESDKHPLALQTHHSKALNLSDVSPQEALKKDAESPGVPKGKSKQADKKCGREEIFHKSSKEQS